MTMTWQEMAPETRALAAGVFQALSALDQIKQPGEAPRPIGMSELYAYASEPAQPLTPRLAAALRDDPHLAADLRRLLVKTSRYHGPRLAAASSGALDHRDGPGFRLDIRPSRADTSQVYVIIQLRDETPAPDTLFVARPETEFLKHPLPSPSGDRLQLLFDAGAEIVQALRDPTSEVLLK